MTGSNLPTALVVGEIGLVRSLGEAGIPLYVGSHYDDNVALYSKYCRRRVRFSHTTSESFAKELVEFGKTQKQKMIFFSDDDRAVLTFSRYRSQLSEYYQFNLPDQDIVEGVLDKRLFAEMTRRLGIPVPQTFTPRSMDELTDCADKITYPCVIKPANKDYWWNPKFLEIVGPYRKAIKCDTRDELISYYKKVAQINDQVIIQEYIAGNDTDLFSANLYFDRQQNLLAYFIGHKLRIYPIHAGVATYVETVQFEDMRDLAVDVARKMNIVGHFNVQFKRDPDTKAMKIIEIHTRNSLWCYLSTGAGLNISAIAYYDIIGMKCPLENHYRTGVRWLDISRDLKALHGYHRLGELSYGSWLKSLRGDIVHHIWSAKDPLPTIKDAYFVMRRRLQRNITDGAAPPL